MHFSGSILIIRNQWYWEQIFMGSKSWNICIKVQFWGTLLVFPFPATLYLLFNTLICLISWLVTVQIQIIQCLYHQFKDGSTLLDDPVSRVSRVKHAHDQPPGNSSPEWKAAVVIVVINLSCAFPALTSQNVLQNGSELRWGVCVQ